jgi:hypothetical protein
MPAIRAIDPAFAVALLTDSLTTEGMTPEQCREVCLDRGLVALATGDEDEQVGFAVAESDHEAVRFLLLDGDAGTCGLLLDRLERLAGERDVGGWCPAARPDLRGLLEGRGFRRLYRGIFLCCESDYYHHGREGQEVRSAREERTEEERRSIFLALVEAQDGDRGVVGSRKEIQKRFGITERQLRRIEQEGIDAEWPPLA